MQKLKEMEPKRSRRTHKQMWELDIPKEKYVGPRGGVMDPQHIEWVTEGTGWFQSVWNVCGCSVLYPYVRYLDKSGRKRRMPADAWVQRTGKGTATRLDTRGSEARKKFLELREECDRGKSEMGAKMATIVTSILDNGGSVSITSR